MHYILYIAKLFKKLQFFRARARFKDKTGASSKKKKNAFTIEIVFVRVEYRLKGSEEIMPLRFDILNFSFIVDDLKKRNFSKMLFFPSCLN